MRRRFPSKSIAHWFRLQVATRHRLVMAAGGWRSLLAMGQKAAASRVQRCQTAAAVLPLQRRCPCSPRPAGWPPAGLLSLTATYVAQRPRD